jgi:hypothetical protein
LDQNASEAEERRRKIREMPRQRKHQGHFAVGGRTDSKASLLNLSQAKAELPENLSPTRLDGYASEGKRRQYDMQRVLRMMKAHKNREDLIPTIQSENVRVLDDDEDDESADDQSAFIT